MCVGAPFFSKESFLCRKTLSSLFIYHIHDEGMCFSVFYSVQRMISTLLVPAHVNVCRYDCPTSAGTMVSARESPYVDRRTNSSVQGTFCSAARWCSHAFPRRCRARHRSRATVQKSSATAGQSSATPLDCRCEESRTRLSPVEIVAQTIGRRIDASISGDVVPLKILTRPRSSLESLVRRSTSMDRSTARPQCQIPCRLSTSPRTATCRRAPDKHSKVTLRVWQPTKIEFNHAIMA